MNEETKTPENVVAFEETATPETAANTQPEADPVADVLKGIDINTLSKDDVFVDLIHQSKLFAFRLMVAAGLLEQIIVREKASEEPKAE